MDELLFDPFGERIYILSQTTTVIDAADGTIAGTIDLGGAPEEAATDGQGHIYVNLGNKDQVAVVDAKTMAVTVRYDLGVKGARPTGLAVDAKNHILFVACRAPATMMIFRMRWTASSLTRCRSGPVLMGPSSIPIPTKSSARRLTAP